METLILATKYVEHYLNPIQGLYHYKYLPSTAHMEEGEFKAHVDDVNRIVSEHQPQLILDDHRDMAFTINPDLQLYTLQRSLPTFRAAGIRKMAQVMSSDFFANLAAEQILADATEGRKVLIVTKFFDTPEGARQWLLSE